MKRFKPVAESAGGVEFLSLKIKHLGFFFLNTGLQYTKHFSIEPSPRNEHENRMFRGDGHCFPKPLLDWGRMNKWRNSVGKSRTSARTLQLSSKS